MTNTDDIHDIHDIHALLRSHRSIRTFTDEAVPDLVVADLVQSGLCAATSSNLQATTVIRVRDSEHRARIAEVTGGQAHVRDAPVFLVWCADLHRSRIACEMAGGTMAAGMTEQFIIATVDVALAAQNAVIAAEATGLGICYIGGIRNDPQVVTDLLRLPDDVYPVFGMCIGHPGQDPDVKPRLPLDLVLRDDVYDDTGDRELIAAYDDLMRRYYRGRTGGSKDTSWSDAIAGLVGGERRPHMREFLRRRGFELR